MKLEDIKVCVMRVGGTNCDAETARAFHELGVQADVKHVNELVKAGNLLDYSMIVFPGGFSFGDYVRSGVIFARSLSAKLGKQMQQFVDEAMPIAHGEGRFLMPVEKEKQLLQKLVDEDMVVFRYCDENGNPANGAYPTNPNGAYYDIAGICNKEGT